MLPETKVLQAHFIFFTGHAVALMCYLIFDWNELVFLLIHLLSVGYLHGATDRAIFFSKSTWRQSRHADVLFYAGYFLIIAGSMLMWWLIPGVMLFVFILYSSYHFGETHFSGWANPLQEKKMLQLIWGLLMLGGILLVPADETLNVLDVDATKNRLVVLQTVGYACWVALVLLITITHRKRSNWKYGLLQLGIVTLILLSVLLTNLLVGFTFFFVYWHSTKSFLDQYNFVRTISGRAGLKTAGLELLKVGAFSLVPVLAAISYWGLDESLNVLDNELLIALAASLSLPHVILHAQVVYKPWLKVPTL